MHILHACALKEIYVWIGCDLTACITSAKRLQCRIERNKSWSRFWRRSYRWIHDFFFDESMMGKMKKTPNFLITIDEMMKTHWKLMRSFWKTLCVRCRLEPHNVTFSSLLLLFLMQKKPPKDFQQAQVDRIDKISCVEILRFQHTHCNTLPAGLQSKFAHQDHRFHSRWQEFERKVETMTRFWSNFEIRWSKYFCTMPFHATTRVVKRRICERLVAKHHMLACFDSEWKTFWKI